MKPSLSLPSPSPYPPWYRIRPSVRCVPSGAARGLHVRDIPARMPGLRSDSCSKVCDGERADTALNYNNQLQTG